MFEKGNVFEQSYTVSDAVYKGFIAVFKDENPLHTNESFAIEKGFSEKVMHGNILNGFISHFIGECLPVKNVIIHAQEINFLKPVFLHNTLKMRAEVDGFYESVQTVEFKYTFVNEQQIKVARGKISIGLL